MKKEQIEEKSKEIDELIANNKLVDAVFTSYSVIKQICKNSLQTENIEIYKNQNVIMLAKEYLKDKNEAIDILNKINCIVRKYDYDHMDVFDEKDARLMRKYMEDFYDILREGIHERK